MILGVVRGSMYATIKHPSLGGRRMLVVDHLDATCRPTGKYVIAIDTVDAGVGDRVLIDDEGGGARESLAIDLAPIRTVIVGIVDDVVSSE